jgi:hypothetical protein
MWSADLCAVFREKRLNTSGFIDGIFRHNCILREGLRPETRTWSAGVRTDIRSDLYRTCFTSSATSSISNEKNNVFALK